MEGEGRSINGYVPGPGVGEGEVMDFLWEEGAAGIVRGSVCIRDVVERAVYGCHRLTDIERVEKSPMIDGDGRICSWFSADIGTDGVTYCAISCR